MTAPRPMPRAAAAIGAGFLAGVIVEFWSTVAASKPRDFAQIWVAARALLHGHDPYALIGPGLAFNWPAPLLYPLPAAVLAIPLSPLRLPVASAVFMFVGVSALAWALTRERWGPLLGLASAAVYFASEVVQWSPLLTAAAVVPALGVVLVAKPTIGTAIFAYRPSWWPIVGGLALAAIAFALEPTWLAHWREALARNAALVPPTAPYRAPVMLPGGVLALLALVRWRRPEARLVAVLACVPQTLLLYETVPLLLVARRWWESAILVAGSYVVLWLVPRSAEMPDVVARLTLSGQLIVWCLYLPATAIVLARPNEGTVPAWLGGAAHQITADAAES